MTKLSYFEALPKELQQKFKNANVIISDIKIDPETDAVPIEKIADRLNLIPSYTEGEYGDNTIHLRILMSYENERFAIAKAIANHIFNRKELVTNLLKETENNEAFENEIAEYQELIERKMNWANNADAKQLLLPSGIFSLALEHTKQKSINKKQLIHKLAKQFQVTPFLIEQELQTRDQKINTIVSNTIPIS